ncbi:hypothetical protein [Amycolatopsis regifaucium]|uniref:Uncharacterized protein n=1 Tax=Amycolatopsis regifaucium TaxID=546365 RepID=A0A154MAH5_9PSEU|nr:hypothetical protein [Amycolatopsis regifaucium]KZB81611.1 hypothetical protein AVL48_06310 [Amycolatopsis regifaucium]OKA06326.1 hypothetical protein ATP06_0224710 [Amycolatopsis regifaucium]SFG64892.1 hypothetical protein SAMN04489731_10125 [Amycolatopsis regifaucium]
MRFVRELAEPWGLLLAATSAGAAWAVQLPVVAALGVGVTVLAARAGIAVASGEKPVAEPEERTLPDVEPGSPEAEWLRRAEAAADGFESISDSLDTGPLADRVADMEPVVRETVDTLRRLAGRTSATGKALARVDASAVAAEKARLRKELKTADDDIRGDLLQSLEAVQAQEDVHARLSSAQRKLLAQLRSGALGLDGLVARAAELSAATGDALLDTTTIGELSDQLEGIRRGVVETEEATRRSLS